MKTIDKASLLNTILNTLGMSKQEALKNDLGYCIELTGNFTKDVQLIVDKYNNSEINLNGVILALIGTPKKRTKLKGITASFQSDVDGCSYIGLEITKNSLTVREYLKSIIAKLESWDYVLGEYCNLDDMNLIPCISLFTEPDHTINKLKDDYRTALIEVLN
jgi:hypothetical protein|tara:strand:+ start:19215 stop:19700 length:486 start_codon:yes stop_codon:yes gene_type:complete